MDEYVIIDEAHTTDEAELREYLAPPVDTPTLIARVEYLEGELRRIKTTAHEGFCGLGRNAGFDACMVVLGIADAALDGDRP